MGFSDVAALFGAAASVFTAAGISSGDIGIVLGAVACAFVAGYALTRTKNGIAG